MPTDHEDPAQQSGQRGSPDRGVPVDEAHQFPAAVAVWSKGEEGPFVYLRVSPGEFIDRITIAEVKAKLIRNEEKREQALREYNELLAVEKAGASFMPEIFDFAMMTTLLTSLSGINRALWRIEEELRLLEQTRDFGERFIFLARQVYHLNDQRAAVKQHVNNLYGARGEIKELPQYPQENTHGQIA